MNRASSNPDYFWLLLTIDVILMFFNRLSVCSIQKFFPRFWFYLKSQLGSKGWEENDEDQELELSNQQCFDNKNDDRNIICREDVESVMGNLGLFCSAESEKLQDLMGFHELSQLFEEKEPSIEEVKEAFHVFDANKDGYIDAEELQRVLQVLGLKEGIGLQNCRNMIRAVDKNKDGKIDFPEFLKFMENSL